MLTQRERQLLDGANLPVDIRDYLIEVLGGGNLRGEHRVEVLRELVAHFEDGLAAGQTAGALLRAFGDREVARRGIAAAVKRSRSPGAGFRTGLANAVRDLRVAVRTLQRNPGYAAVAVLTLCLGIGANTAVFSVVNGVLLKPLPYPDPDRLMMLLRTDARGATRLPWSAPDVRDLEEAKGAFADVVGYRWRDVTLTGMGEPRYMGAVAVSGSLLGVFGVQPALGRDIRSSETRVGGPAEVVVSYAFWRDQLGGDPAAVGRTLQLSGVSYELIGVAPADFEYPHGAEIWLPGQWDAQDFPRGRMTLRVVGRLAPGETVEGARAQLSALAASLSEAHPDVATGLGADLMPLEEYSVGGVRLGLLVLLGAVAMVLLIACVNVANLVLVRGANRSVEMAVRTTLGAGRAALVRQLLAESLVLSFAGCASGVLLASVGVRGLRTLAAGRIPRMPEVAVDGTVIAFAAGLAVLVALLFGLAPALRLSRASISGMVREGRAQPGTVPGRRGRARAALLALEAALSLMLLVGAGLLLRSFARIRAVDLGFDPAGVLEFTVTLPGTRYDEERSVAFFDALRDRLAAIPGVEAVGLTSGSPLGSSHRSLTIGIVGQPAPPPGEEPLWLMQWVSPGTIGALGIPLLRGRDLSPADRSGRPGVALISRAAADRYFAGDDPIGRQFKFDEDEPAWTIVGVVGDVRSLEVTQSAEPEAYVPYAQWSRASMTALLRTGTNVPGLETAVRREVASLDPALAIYDVRRLERAVASSTSSERFYLFLLALFATLAVILAAVGMYGVVAYIVAGRTREIGIRIALGADPRGVTWMVAGQGLRPVLAGTLIGILGSLAGARVLASLLYEVDARDPYTLAASPAVLIAVAALACLLPAWRAARIPPTEAFRTE